MMQKKEIIYFGMGLCSIIITISLITLLALFPSNMNDYHSDFQVSEKLTPSTDSVANLIPKSGATDAPIDIVGDDWTTCPVVTGSGTSNDPYVIADQIIDAGGGGAGISIMLSHSYGIIENCTIINYFIGIYLGNVSNCKLIDNTVINSTIGIELVVDSENCTLIGNTVNDAALGIYFSYILNCTLIDNIVTDTSEHGIYLLNSPNCTVMGNFVTNSNEMGIYLYNSPYCNLTENSGKNCLLTGIKILNSANCTLIGNSAENNGGWGLNIYYSSNCTMIENNFFENNKSGISIMNSSNCLIFGNNLIDNDRGINFFGTLNCSVTNNTISYNGIGILINENSENNSIFENVLIKNVWGSIDDNGINNDIHDNLIINILTFSFTASKITADIDEAINFICTSTDGYAPLTYSWDFGDGTTSSLENPSHGYSTAGNYTVILTVTEGDNESSSKSMDIEVVSDNSSNIPGYPVGILIFSTIIVIKRIQRQKKE